MAKPWVHHQNSSATSLSRLGLEKAIHPGRSFIPLVKDYHRKELPLIPNDMDQSDLKRPLSEESLGRYHTKGKDVLYSQQNSHVDGVLRLPMGAKSHSLPESTSKSTSRHSDSFKLRLQDDIPERVLPPPPPPPMSKSAQKILQLTGFDPISSSRRNHMNEPLPSRLPPMSKSAQKVLQLTGFDPPFDHEPIASSYYSVSPESSGDESSGSQYSQPESETQEYVHPRHHWATLPTLNQGEPSTGYHQYSFYSASERSASISDKSIVAVAAASASATSLRYRDRPAKKDQRGADLTGIQSSDTMTNDEFMAAERARYARQRRNRFDDGFERNAGSRYGHELTEVDRKDLVPQPLAIRAKPRVNEENGKLSYYSEPTSPTGLPYGGLPVRSRMPPPHKPRHKRKFGTGKHPMKSPFPFATSAVPKEREVGEPEQRFRKKVSRAMRRLSGGPKPPMRQSVIWNREREAGGPDTPIPSGFKAFFPSQETIQKGNEHFQDAVHKAKKGLRIRTADERRREDLKKQIVVVGITDQSPGK